MAQSFYHLEEVIVVVDVLNSMVYYGMVRVVVVVCLSVGQSGFHHQQLFYAGSLEEEDSVTE